MFLEAARARDRGEDVAMTASMCKYYASEMCGRVADRAVQMFGGSGYVADFSPIERYVRDVIDSEVIPREDPSAHVHAPRELDEVLAQLRPLAQQRGLYLPQLPVEH